MKKSIDLIIPAYNEGSTIKRTLDSIYDQNLKNKFLLNVIVVVNGTTDNTYAEARKNAKNTDEIKTNVIEIKESGKTRALNKGLENIHSEYAGYMDADIKLGKDVIHKTYSTLINEKLNVVGALNVPIYKFLKKDTLLYQIEKVQQMHREERRRVIPCGAYICFKRNTITRFPENIHSEDTWLGLHAAYYYGWQTVRVLQDAKVYFTPPANWLDYIKQQARFERGYYQLMENFPHLDEAWKTRRTNFKHQRTKEEINNSILKRMEKEGIPKRRLNDLWKIIDEIFVETCEELGEKLISKDGKWEPIISTKKIK